MPRTGERLKRKFPEHLLDRNGSTPTQSWTGLGRGLKVTSQRFRTLVASPALPGAVPCALGVGDSGGHLMRSRGLAVVGAAVTGVREVRA